MSRESLNHWKVRKCSKVPNKKGLYAVIATRIDKKGKLGRSRREFFIRCKVSEGDIIDFKKRNLIIKPKDP